MNLNANNVLLEQLEAAGKTMAFVIGATPSGDRRNRITDANIHLMCAVDAFKQALAIAVTPDDPAPVTVRKLSTGQPSTWGSYYDNCKALGMKKALAYVEEQILKAPNGRNEEVIADESQVIHILGRVEFGP